MTTNPIILKLIECLAYTIEEDESDELEFNLEINGASLEEEDEDDEDDEDWDVAELSDFECLTCIEMRTNAHDYFEKGFEREHLKELLELLRSST